MPLGRRGEAPFRALSGGVLDMGHVRALGHARDLVSARFGRGHTSHGAGRLEPELLVIVHAACTDAYMLLPPARTQSTPPWAPA